MKFKLFIAIITSCLPAVCYSASSAGEVSNSTIRQDYGNRVLVRCEFTVGASQSNGCFAKCPAGTSLLSGGYQIINPEHDGCTTEGFLNTSRPDVERNGWEVDVGYPSSSACSGQQKFYGFALCIED